MHLPFLARALTDRRPASDKGKPQPQASGFLRFQIDHGNANTHHASPSAKISAIADTMSDSVAVNMHVHEDRKSLSQR